MCAAITAIKRRFDGSLKDNGESEELKYVWRGPYEDELDAMVKKMTLN